MSDFIEKLGSYQIMTNLLPGVFFGTGLKLLLGITLPIQNTGEEIIVYYFMGLIINRISSLIVKPILNKCIFIKEASYSDYFKAAKIDPKIDVLSETNNHFRAILTSSLLLLITAILTSICIGYYSFLCSNCSFALAIANDNFCSNNSLGGIFVKYCPT